MAIVRWEPFRELAALQNEMSRWMNTLAAPGAGNGQSSTWLPAVSRDWATAVMKENRITIGKTILVMANHMRPCC